MNQAISVVVFDLGRVLIDFDHGKFVSFLRAHSAPFESTDDFVAKCELVAFECGAFCGDEFATRVLGHLPSPVEKQVLLKQWEEIFEPIDPMLSLMDELHRELPVYILSNTNEIHWRYLLETYRLADRCSGLIASFEVGVMKPDPKIYLEAARRFNFTPHEAVFIDDIEANVRGAEAVGFRGIHHVSPETTRKAIATMRGSYTA